MSHIKLISKFITNNLLNAVCGYYLSTLEASVQHLIDLNIDCKWKFMWILVQKSIPSS